METTFNCMADSTVSPQEGRMVVKWQNRLDTHKIEIFKPWSPKLCGKKFFVSLHIVHTHVGVVFGCRVELI